MNGLPPGLQGWVQSDQDAQRRQAGELQRAQGLMQIRGLLQKQQQEQAFRSEISQARTPEEQAAVASKYMGPDALARMQQSSLDRRATLQAANTNAAALREQRLHELTIRGQQRADEIEQRAREGRISQAQAAADRAALQQNMARLVAGLRQSSGGAAKFTNIKDDPMHPGVQVGFNTSTGRMERVPSAVGVGPGAMPSGQKGEELLAGLDPIVASQVKALAEGRQAFPSGFALKAPYWQNMISLVSQYDPSFDAVNYQARASTRRDFTSGTQARNVTAMNTVIGHLDTLEKAADKLKNTDFPAYNTIANFSATHIGDPRVKEFQVAKEAVANELMRVFRQVGASTTEIQEWGKTIDESGSPAQLKGAIRTAAELLQSRIDAVADQYQRGMGSASKTFQPFSPQALDTLKRLKGTQAQTAPAAAIQYLKDNPQTKDAFKAKYRYLPEGM